MLKKPIEPKIGKRLLALFIDFFIISILVVLKMELEKYLGKIENGYLFFILIVLLKDGGSRSFGKMIVRIWIVDPKLGTRVSVFRRISRNLTFFIWPIEVGLILLGKNRIGDRISRTMVSDAPPIYR
jgi:uncharacterized RDD family membrane protein YckC